MKSIKRRAFLKGALAGSAIAAAPFNILKAGASPNSKLNIACIGVGLQGSGNAEYLARKDNVIFDIDFFIFILTLFNIVYQAPLYDP